MEHIYLLWGVCITVITVGNWVCVSVLRKSQTLIMQCIEMSLKLKGNENEQNEQQAKRWKQLSSALIGFAKTMDEYHDELTKLQNRVTVMGEQIEGGRE